MTGEEGIGNLRKQVQPDVKGAEYKRREIGVPVVAQWLTNPTRNHEVSGLIPALAQWVKDLVLPQAVV